MTNRYWEYPPSIATIISLIQQGVLSPLPYLAETWQDVIVPPDPRVWAWVNPLTGLGWRRDTTFTAPTIGATANPALNENCRLRSVQLWIVRPAPVIPRASIVKGFELDFQLAINPVNLVNATCFFGMTTGIADTRASNDIIGFGVTGAGGANRLQTITNNGGAETTNTGFGETMGQMARLKIRVTDGAVGFYLDDARIALHITNLRDALRYINFYVAANATGGATPYIGTVKARHLTELDLI